MAQARNPSLTLHDPAAIEALPSPHWLEIVAALGDAENATIAALARRLGRTPHSLYYHVKLLERAGVIRLADTRRRGRRDERIWTLAGERILLDASAMSPASIVKASKAIDAMLRLTSRELSAALRRHARRPDAKPHLAGVRMKARLDERALGRVAGLIEEIGRVVSNANRASRPGQTYAVTLVLRADRGQDDAVRTRGRHCGSPALLDARGGRAAVRRALRPPARAAGRLGAGEARLTAYARMIVMAWALAAAVLTLWIVAGRPPHHSGSLQSPTLRRRRAAAAGVLSHHSFARGPGIDRDNFAI
jgi:DNA-binding transcriptional ArsR family regulator